MTAISMLVVLTAVTFGSPVDNDAASLVAVQGAIASIEAEQQQDLPLPDPTPPPKPSGQIVQAAPPVQSSWRPTDHVKEAVERFRNACQDEARRLIESAKVTAEVRVNFDDPPQRTVQSSPLLGQSPEVCPCDGQCPSPESPVRQESPQSGYAAALAQHQATGQPFAILIGTKNCPACLTAEKALAGLTIPHVYLDVEDNNDLVVKNYGGTPSQFPALVVFYPNAPGRRIGYPELLKWMKGVPK